MFALAAAGVAGTSVGIVIDLCSWKTWLVSLGIFVFSGLKRLGQYRVEPTPMPNRKYRLGSLPAREFDFIIVGAGLHAVFEEFPHAANTIQVPVAVC